MSSIFDWLVEEHPIIAFSLLVVALLIAVGIIILIILLLGHIFGWFNIPTLHLNGQCQDFYQGISSKYGTTYNPVHVCP